MRSVSPIVLLCTTAFVALYPSLVWARGTLYHDGFIEELVASEPGITGAFIPNPQGDGLPPMLLISSKSGMVHVLKDPDNSMTTELILDLSAKLCTNGERGMQSITPHPRFAENFYIYIYYTLLREDCLEDPVYGPFNRLSRFKMDPDTLQINPSTEDVLLECAPTNKFYHNGGAIKFGHDEKLYVATGDAGGADVGTSQDLTNLHGVVMRLNDDGSVPDDNPLYNGVPCGKSQGTLPSDSPENAVCSEIFAYGLRNPFRIVMDPKVTEMTRFLINDVGGAVWEEISEGGTNFAGMNYGWPKYEGPCLLGSTTQCPMYDSKAKSDVEDYDEQVMPLYYYEHRSEREGGCVSGGAFVPPGIWPVNYTYLYADFIFQGIYNLVEAPEKTCTTCVPPVPAYVNETFYTSIKDEDQHENVARIVDMFFGPYKDTQALYIFKMGGNDNVWRIRYAGSSDLPPVASIQVMPGRHVEVGSVVGFNGSQSYDPEGQGLVYEWDFGDGDFSKEENPIHVYSNPRPYTVRLTVTDVAGNHQTDSAVIIVGTLPTLNITTPPEGVQFFVGETFTLSGAAFDAAGGKLNDGHISWEVRKHHADHWHPFLDQTVGNNVQISPAPEPEDYLAATNSYLEIIMYATDDNGLTSTTVREVFPRLVEVCIDSEPQGLEVYVDEYPIKTPLMITSWVNHDLRLRATTQEGLSFYTWNDGSVIDNREIRLEAESNPGLLAMFCSDGNKTCVEEAEARGSVNLLVARCPNAPTAAPSAAASATPSTIHSIAPSSAPSDEVEEEWPIDEENASRETDDNNFQDAEDNVSENFEGEELDDVAFTAGLSVFIMTSLYAVYIAMHLLA